MLKFQPLSGKHSGGALCDNPPDLFTLQKQGLIMAEAKNKADKASTPEDDKKKALVAALAQIEKNFGKGAIMKMDGSHQDENLEVISTGSLGVSASRAQSPTTTAKSTSIRKPNPAYRTCLSFSQRSPEPPSTISWHATPGKDTVPSN